MQLDLTLLRPFFVAGLAGVLPAAQQPEEEQGSHRCHGRDAKEHSSALLMQASHFPPTGVLIQHFSLQKLSEVRH